MEPTPLSALAEATSTSGVLIALAPELPLGHAQTVTAMFSYANATYLHALGGCKPSWPVAVAGASHVSNPRPIDPQQAPRTLHIAGNIQDARSCKQV